MRLTPEERTHIDEQMRLLFPKYKKVEESDSQVRYQYEKTTISVFKGIPARGEPDAVLFLFRETNDPFSVAHIDFVVNKKKELSTDWDYLLRFLAEHREEMLDYSFCNKCVEKYEKHLRRKWFFERFRKPKWMRG